MAASCMRAAAAHEALAHSCQAGFAASAGAASCMRSGVEEVVAGCQWMCFLARTKEPRMWARRIPPARGAV